MQADIISFPSKAPSGATPGAGGSRKAPITRSSWIEAVRYHGGFLVAFLKSGGAYIFSGVEPHVAGLVLAGTGGKSVGHALHQLLREKKADGTLGDWKYAYEWKEAGKEVEELRRLMP